MEKCARLEIVCALIAHLGFKSLTLRHILSENVSFQTFFLYRKLQKKSGCDKIGDENITAWQTERIGGFATT